MGLICSFICFLLSFLLYNRDKRIYSPGVLFVSFWGILIFLSTLQLYGIHETSDHAYIIVVLGVVFFSIGTICGNNIKIPTNYVYSLNNKFYKYCIIVCLLALILNIQIIYKYIISGFGLDMIYSAMAATTDGADTELSSLYNTNLVRVQQYIGYPLLFAIVPISIAEYISTKKKKFLYVALLLSSLRFFIDLRRTYLVIIVVFVIFLLLVRTIELNNKIRLPKLSFRRKILILFVITGLAISFSYFSVARRGDVIQEEYSLASNFYYYYVGSLPYLSHRLELLNNVEYTFGITAFRGFFSPIYAVLGGLGLLDTSLMEIADSNINSLHHTVLLISDTHSFNSYATCFFEFYLDGNFLGVIIISFLFGLYAQKLFKQMLAFKNNRFMFKYSLFCSLYIYLSVLIFSAAIVCYIWPFILERVMYRKKRLN